jgi:hypothetical protein
MATPKFCCGFECGVASSHWPNATPATYSTSTVRNGARSMRFNPAAASNTSIVVLTTTSTSNVGRIAIRFATLPADSCLLWGFTNGTNFAGLGFSPVGNILCAASVSGGVVGIAAGVGITTGTWYVVDLVVDSTATTWTVNGRVDGVALGQRNATGFTAGAIGRMFIGSAGKNATFDAFFDDVIWSQTSADYPMGDGYVNHFVPTSDGTHTATTTTIVKGTLATPVGGNVAGSTDVFNWLNGVPILGGATDNTRLVNQQTAGAGLYAEVKFGPAPGISTPTVAPRAVEVITADREAATATCNFITKINDNGTEADVVNLGTVAGVTADRFVTKQFATGPAGAWTALSSGAGAFNNLKARFGYSSDATPDVYWRGIMVEAEFAAVVAGVTTKKLSALGVG